LDAAAFEDAFGLAGTQSAGLMAAQFEAMSKRMHHGMASRNGLYAAVLAQGGYTGIKRVFECDYGGFLSTFGEGHSPDAAQISDGLGLRWETERISAKAFAAMSGLHAAIDAGSTIGCPRIVARNDEAFDREGPLSRGKTRVRILFRDGQSLEKLLQAGRGLLPPLTNLQIVGKIPHLDSRHPGPRQAGTDRTKCSGTG
jgi:MmgE/PrpD N-terminal domain